MVNGLAGGSSKKKDASGTGIGGYERKRGRVRRVGRGVC